jgi:hypothetical protein
MAFSANPQIDAQTARLASLVTSASTALQADAAKLNLQVATNKQQALALTTRAQQLRATAPHTTAQQIVSWIDQLISWAKDVVSWAHGADWFGWLNWFINDVNGAITDLQNLANWVNANSNAINEFGTIVSDATSIIGWIEDLIAIFG